MSFFVIRKIENPYEALKTEVKTKINIDSYRDMSSQSIDSILYTFGVKREWIMTHFKDNKVLWYTKNADIPKGLNSTKVNLELTNYLRNIGLNPLVTEDIKTRNITFTVYNDSNALGLPLLKVFIKHEDKK